ncbi:sensor histidine kinase [Brevibacterium marinum]|uniref:histidine kinase n=1 Tax=Brevibacterium marinum TaxID=418643 RepID=A0A846S3L8_9MICO|nr:histidine kinase [Brevibacterium marinum]NJC56731.1 signal transduction histidine kinase [Brevibacterium marinum]
MGVRRTEVVLAGAVAASLAMIIVLAQTDTEAPLRPLSYLFAFGFGAVLLLRRGLPKTVVVLSVLGTFAYYSLELTPIGVALPVVAALYSAAEVGLTRFSVGAGAVVFVVSTAFRIRDDSLPLGRLLGAESISTLALIAAAITLGYAMATHRRFASQQEQLLRLQDERLREEADQRVQNERLQLSRDLHDTLGHKLSVISLHSNVGLEALDRRGPGTAPDSGDSAVAEALERVHDEAVGSLSDLRSMVRVLRTGDESTRTSLGVDGIETLLDRAREAGMSVESNISLAPGTLPSPVESVVFRVVQEGITNVLRHSSAAALSVTVGLDDEEVVVSVVDDGLGAAALEGGHGLLGMSERVRLLGGDLSTQARPGEGFELRATLPRRLPE